MRMSKKTRQLFFGILRHCIGVFLYCDCLCNR